MQDAGAALAPDIKQELAEIYRLNAAYTANTVTGAANKANIRATFNIPTAKQAMIALEDERPVMSKIAFNSLQDANALVHRLQNEMAQFIALGENQDEFIKRIQNVMQDGQKRAKRIAQTEGTRVQSQARYNTIHEAAQMGINVQKRWSTRMANSRESHIVLNGKVVGADEKFKTITGYELAYPGDPSAPAAEVINCYCVLVPVVGKATGNGLKSTGQNGTMKAWDEAYRKRKIVKNSDLANGIPYKGEPNSVFDKTDDDGNVLQRRVYGADGMAKYDFDTSDHKNPNAHPFGAHKHIFGNGKKDPHGEPLRLTELELEQNADIIKRGVNYFDD